MIGLRGFYEALSVSSPPAPPHCFRLGAEGEVFAPEEAEGCARRVYFVSCAVRAREADLERLLRAALPDEGGLEIFASSLRGGRLCFCLLSPGEADESRSAAAAVLHIAACLRDGRGPG